MTELNDFFRIELLKTYLNDITVPIFENCKKMLNHSTLLYCAVCEQRFRKAGTQTYKIEHKSSLLYTVVRKVGANIGGYTFIKHKLFPEEY